MKIKHSDPERPGVIIDIDPSRNDYIELGQELVEGIVEVVRSTSVQHPSDGDALMAGVLRGLQNHFGLKVGEPQK